MLDTIKDSLKSFFNSRLLPVTVVYAILFVILVNRLFQLQIAQVEKYVKKSEKRTSVTREIKASRGNIYHCNGTL